MLPVEDWEKAGPTQPNTIERKTIRKTRDVFMISPSVTFHVKSNSEKPYERAKRNSFGNSLQLAKNRHGAKGPESADPREDFSISLLSKEPFSGRDVDNLFPARPGPGPKKVINIATRKWLF